MAKSHVDDVGCQEHSSFENLYGQVASPIAPRQDRELLVIIELTLSWFESMRGGHCISTSYITEGTA
jgi:hypothetical protein